MRRFLSLYGMTHLTLVKSVFPAICEKAPFSNVKRDLHFKMQVIHIPGVLGGGVESLGPEQTIEELYYGCEEKGQEGHQEEGDQEEGRQEEEIIDAGQLVSSRLPLT
jgi:hypothetical protein